MPITACTATTKDIRLLVEMMREFYAESDYPLDEQWAADSFSALLANESYGGAWIACFDGEPAGYGVLTVRFSMEYGGLDAAIDDLFVRPSHRRCGVGRAVLDALFAECRRRKVLAVHVEVGTITWRQNRFTIALDLVCAMMGARC